MKKTIKYTYKMNLNFLSSKKIARITEMFLSNSEYCKEVNLSDVILIYIDFVLNSVNSNGIVKFPELIIFLKNPVFTNFEGKKLDYLIKIIKILCECKLFMKIKKNECILVLENYRDEYNFHIVDNELTNDEAEIYKKQAQDFFKRYPKHEGKEKCIKWFLINTPSQELFSKIMHRLNEFIELKKYTPVDYLPNPFTWLNEKRWEDLD